MNTTSKLKVSQNIRYSDVSSEKAAGAHYTPRILADFVARQITANLSNTNEILRVIDPAVGDGELVLALLEQLKKKGIERVEVHGFETSASALNFAEARIKAAFPNIVLRFTCRSFLDFVLRTYRHTTPSLFSQDAPHFEQPPCYFDFVIANPPYVRTQVMGAKQAQQLAEQFNLSGRIDLYHAFLLAIAETLKPDGIVGIIVSNRFMTTKSGAAVRADIIKQFDVLHVWDLGDSKIFAAAVLPAILLLKKKGAGTGSSSPRFTSVYSSKSADPPTPCADVVAGLSLSGLIEIESCDRFFVEHGGLEHGSSHDGVWRIKTDNSAQWLATVTANTWGKFRDIGKIRVGVKTTADKVFIRSDWDRMPEQSRPELLKPLITHHIARRFRSLDVNEAKKILYPHTVIHGRRCAVSLENFPRTARYLEEHRKMLEGRTYVIESGRHWYELWVPQDPDGWKAPKLVFRDISEQPTFWIDLEGNIVNGDCYWLSCSDQSHPNLLWLALAVGNSTFAAQFYDRCFCNKLYAGRRRYCTQYVEHFPLPDPNKAISQEMVRLTQVIYHDPSSPNASRLEAQLDRLTWQAFGVSVEEGSR